LFKLLAALIIFFAGVGVGCSMCCCGCAKSHHRAPKLRSIKMPLPAYDTQGGNVIIINTDGKNGMPEIIKNQPHKMHKNFSMRPHHMGPHHKGPQNPNMPAQNPDMPVQNPNS
jgi:hypothetical protein